MSETREPGRPDDPGEPREQGISLPPWVDDAIARSRTRGGEDADVASEGGPAGEMAVNPPPVAQEPSAEWQPVSRSEPPEAGKPVVVAHSPREARRRAVMPWIALALIFAAAALVLGYVLLTRPPQQ